MSLLFVTPKFSQSLFSFIFIDLYNKLVINDITNQLTISFAILCLSEAQNDYITIKTQQINVKTQQIKYLTIIRKFFSWLY